MYVRTSLRWTPQQPLKVAAVSHVRTYVTALDPPAALESGSSYARTHVTALDPPAALESGSSFALTYVRTSLRWTPQQPLKVAAVTLRTYVRHCAGPPSNP